MQLICKQIWKTDWLCYENKKDRKFGFLLQLWPPLPPWRWSRSNKANTYWGKNLPIRLSKYLKARACLLCPKIASHFLQFWGKQTRWRWGEGAVRNKIVTCPISGPSIIFLYRKSLVPLPWPFSNQNTNQKSFFVFFFFDFQTIWVKWRCFLYFRQFGIIQKLCLSQLEAEIASSGKKSQVISISKVFLAERK